MANDIWNPEKIKNLAGRWSDEDEQELFKTDDGYWEKGMKTLPVVAYIPNDKMTHKKVRKHFGYTDEK